MTDVPPELAVRREAPDRNLALELVRVTEAAAMAAGRWVGRGDKNGGDGAAVDAMRTLISTVSMRWSNALAVAAFLTSPPRAADRCCAHCRRRRLRLSAASSTRA